MSCATKDLNLGKKKSADLLSSLCEIGNKNLSISGTAWMWASSKEAKGQFPVTVKAEPDRLALEVNNPLGGTEAQIHIQGSQLTVLGTGENKRKMSGNETWGGIPLVVAKDLFVGKVPCPSFVRTENFKKSASNSSFSPDEIKAKYSMILSQDKDQLWVRVLNPAGRAQEEYIYETEIVFGRRVVKSLVWKKHTEKSAPLLLEFEFSQLDKNDGAFLKWKVKSSSEEVRLNWRDRKVIEK